MLPLTAAQISEASFLDKRLPLHGKQPVWQPLPASGKRQMAPAWLFHTAFCGSTLLSRALQAPPQVMALREPSALLDLALARSGTEFLAQDQLQDRAQRLTDLLARPWVPAGRVLIKPTNQVNRIIPALLRVHSRSKAILLYSSLDEFLLSCCKKMPGAEVPLRWMAQALLPGTDLQQRLAIPLTHAFNFAEAAVLTWYAQMEIYAHALAGDVDARLRSLDMQIMLNQPVQSVQASAKWLGLEQSSSDWKQSVSEVFSRNAKDAAVRFAPSDRAIERQQLALRYGDWLQATLHWADQVVKPAATLPSNWQPLIVAD